MNANNFDSESSQKALEVAEIQREYYRREFLEDDRWKELAKEAGVMLPPFYTRPSDTAIKSTLRRLRVSWDNFVEAFGWKDAADFERLNPTWSMRPLTGLILELWQEKQMMREACKNAAEGRGLTTGKTEAKITKYPKGTGKRKRAPLDMQPDQ